MPRWRYLRATARARHPWPSLSDPARGCLTGGCGPHARRRAARRPARRRAAGDEGDGVGALL
eukprot:6174986-Pleurochrysis_carterae.AAC.5